MSTKEENNKDKEVTTAPGADSSSEKTGVANENAANGETQASDVPAWLSELLQSNQAVLESNKAVLDRIDDFNQNAATVVKDIVKEARKAGSGESSPAENKVPDVKLNKKATYVVAKGKRFQNSATRSIVEAGSDVSDLSAEKLKSLLSKGIIEESE